MRPLRKVSVALLILIALLLAAFFSMNRRLNRYLDAHPAAAECLRAGGTAAECKDAKGPPSETEGADGTAEQGGPAAAP